MQPVSFLRVAGTVDVRQETPSWFVHTTGQDWQRVMGSDAPVPPFDEQIAVSIHAGECPSGGYWVRVRSVAVDHDAGIVRVTYASGSPGPEDMVTLAFTYPRDVVTINRSDLPDGQVSVEFCEQGVGCRHRESVSL